MADAFDPESVAAAFGEIMSLSTGDAERVRERAFFACSELYSAGATLPLIDRIVESTAMILPSLIDRA